MGASPNERLRTTPLAGREWGVFALMPLPESAGSRLEESLQGGQAWAATALTFLVVGLSALAFLFHLLRSCLGGRAALPFLAAAAGLACVGGGMPSAPFSISPKAASRSAASSIPPVTCPWG